ncbi:hypothetical protein Bhyg_07470 [Pseudolycoriella hygida]|uniref:Peptidase A2 domain-containing protein n=1 Tax=Pseudolycoriella hygida TaxID=35572 RepID=A0A9Q0N4K6_9DIPT|nr:hypothetical protein Bhyg_07470 [Pseudolycoriella hygida]
MINSNHKKISKLLQDTVLGDKKPSGLLNEMKRLSTPEINEELLKTLWIKRLPTEVRVILSTSTQTLAEMSELADKIVEVANLSNVNAVSKSMQQTSDSQISSLERCIAQLTKAVDKLNQRNSDQRTGPSNRSRSKSRGRSSDNRAATPTKKNSTKIFGITSSLVLKRESAPNHAISIQKTTPLNCNLTPITHHRSELERCVKITPNVDSSGKRKNINLNNELFIGDNNTTPNSPKSPTNQPINVLGEKISCCSVVNENPINLNATINRLTVTDHNLNKGFLIDSGADVSFTTDIRWTPGESNEVADFLSRIQGVSSDGKIDFELLAKEQENDSELKSILEKEQVGDNLSKTPSRNVLKIQFEADKPRTHGKPFEFGTYRMLNLSNFGTHQQDMLTTHVRDLFVRFAQIVQHIAMLQTCIS